MKGFSQKEFFLLEKDTLPQQKIEQTFFSSGFSSTFHHGAILPHREEVNEIIEGHTQGVELSYTATTFGEKKWQQDYNYPKVGVSGLVINLGNKKQLGLGFGILPYLELPITQQKISWKVKIGYGLGYIEKPFDGDSNFKNGAIGSHFNALIYANLIGEFKLVDRFTSSCGLSFIHYSNGSYARPNLGINILSLTAGLNYSFGDQKQHVATNVIKRPRLWSKQFSIGAGVKEIPPVDGLKYVVSTISFNVLKVRAEKSSFGFGSDLFYNSSLSHLIARDSLLIANSLDNYRLGVFGMYSFDFGKISVSLALGSYLLSTYKGNGLLYNKLETRYWINEKLFLRAAMKTHLVVADFIEYGIGFKL